MTQLISVSSPGSTKKLPYSPSINLKKMPSPREHNQIMTAFIKSANEAIENNTDERLLRVYRSARLQVEQFMAKIVHYAIKIRKATIPLKEYSQTSRRSSWRMRHCGRRPMNNLLNCSNYKHNIIMQSSNCRSWRRRQKVGRYALRNYIYYWRRMKENQSYLELVRKARRHHSLGRISQRRMN